jgi:maltokinase
VTTAEQLEPLVRAWLPGQRWFAGKGRDAGFVVDLLAELQQDPDVAIWLVRADYGDGETETYQLPLTVRREPAGSLEHVQLGTLDTEDGPRWVYDALHDKDLTPLWLTGMRDETTQGDGRIRFHRFADAERIPVDQPSLVLSGEQSNTSMVFGDAAIMKVFRRLQPGANPDIEIGAALTQLGAKHVPALLGAVEADVDGAASSLAMLQEFLTSATDGWELAKISVRDLMAERDLHAEEAGGDFAAEAERLGQAVAETHVDLATAFGTSQATADQLRARADGMRERLTRADRAGSRAGRRAAQPHLRRGRRPGRRRRRRRLGAAHPRRPASRTGAAHRLPLGPHRLRGRAHGGDGGPPRDGLPVA